MHVVVDALRVAHVFEHDVADVQRFLAEAKLEQLDGANLQRQLVLGGD